MSTVLAQLSFLRTSDTSDEGHRSYHFLHLTFQEYFAAQYYVQHWKSGQPLPYLRISNRKARLESILPEPFLQQEKYNPRYDVLWRFITGMLQGQDEDHLRRFFALIEDEPRDLLGPVHQRLAMHCLSEVESSNKTSTSISLRENLEEQLSRWVLFECESSGTVTLAGDMQFPESVLEAILQEGSEDQRLRFMQSLPARRTSLPSFVTFITNWLREGVSPDTMAIICKGLKNNPQHLPEETLNALAERLVDQHYSIRRSALRILGRQQNLPEGILEDVAKRLEDSSSRIRVAAAYALSERLDQLGEFLKAMTVRSANLNDPYLERINLRLAAVQSTSANDSLEATFWEDCIEEPWPTELLGAESNTTLQKKYLEETLPEELHEVVAALPLVKEYLEGNGPIELLKCLAKPPLPENILAAVAKRLDDRNSNVREAAANALGSHSILPEEIVEKVVERLDDKRGKVRKAAARAIGAQATLLGEILEAIAKRLDDKDSNVREDIVYALGSQYNLPSEILKAVAKRLDDTESNVRQAVANIFLFQPNFHRVNYLFILTRTLKGLNREFFSMLPDDHLTSLIANLDDNGSQLKEAFTSAWIYKSTLPMEIFRAMAQRLNDEDSQVRKAIGRALRSQLQSLLYTFTTVTALYEDGDIISREAFAQVLEEYSAWKEEIAQTVVLVEGFWKAQEETNYTDTCSGAEGETPLSPAMEDEISVSLATEDEVSLSPATEDNFAEVLFEDTDPREEVEEVEAVFTGRLLDPNWNPYLQYEGWLKQSFHEQLIWYIEDGNLCLRNEDGFWKLAFISREKQDSFLAKIQNVRANLGVPQ